MNSLTALSTITVTVRHPDGTVTLRAPADLPLGELMPDFLEVIGQPDVEGWVLSPDGGGPYANQSSLAELGVDDGTMLTLHKGIDAASAGDGAAVSPTPRALAVRATPRVCPRPLSERTARKLPVKLSGAARCAMAIRALADTASRHEPAAPRDPGVPARPRSRGPHGPRQCRGLGQHGVRPATGTGSMRRSWRRVWGVA